MNELEKKIFTIITDGKVFDGNPTLSNEKLLSQRLSSFIIGEIREAADEFIDKNKHFNWGEEIENYIKDKYNINTEEK